MADDAAGAVRRTPRPAPAPELIYGTARTDPIGTVREHDDGTTAVKVSMGDDTTKGQHVWCWMNCKLEVRWLHHYDVAEWAVLLADPGLHEELDEWREAAAAGGKEWLVTRVRAALGTPEGRSARMHALEVRAERDLAVWLHAELQHKLTLPCGDCHPCNNWADETWRRAGRKPPHVVTWEDKLAETRGLYARLDDAIKLIEEMSDHMRQDTALLIGVETRLAALQGDQPAAGSKYRDVELVYWRGRAEAAEQRLKDAANFYPDVPPEPPVGTTYSNPDGSTAWVRREDGWHCGRTEPCRNCPCEWQEAWDFGIRDPKLTRILGDQPSEQPRPLLPPDDPCQDLRCRRVDGRCVGMHCAHCGEPCGAQGHTCSKYTTQPDPSGRITDGGPVQPFTATDHEEPNHA